MKKIVVYLTSEKIGLTISEKNANKENIERYGMCMAGG